MTQKGPGFEELVRAYFAHQGFFALRGTKYKHEDEEVTDIDVWLYSRQSASVRTRTVVDVKSKAAPRAFERILLVRGLQLALGCDKGVVATTNDSSKVARFAQQQKVSLLTKAFLDRTKNKPATRDRMTLEQFTKNIQKYEQQKRDGDWLRYITDAKSALISLRGYSAFNKAMIGFRFFAERAETRPYHKEQALRGAYLTAALACIALDSALERVVYDDSSTRYHAIENGVTYGDASVQSSIKRVLDVIAEGMENGRVISKRARDAMDKMLRNVRADIIAEHFTKERNAQVLVDVAKELDDRAHHVEPKEIQRLSIQAKSVLGVYADFVQVDRVVLLNGGLSEGAGGHPSKHDYEASQTKEKPKRSPGSSQERLI